MQNVSSDPLIPGNSGLRVYSKSNGLFVGAFDLKEPEPKPELPKIGGSEDKCCLTKNTCINVYYPTTTKMGNHFSRVHLHHLTKTFM